MVARKARKERQLLETKGIVPVDPGIIRVSVGLWYVSWCWSVITVFFGLLQEAGHLLFRVVSRE